MKLREFTFDDFTLIQKEITSAEFLKQWAGPKYYFPLNWEQMKAQMNKYDGLNKQCHLYSAVVDNQILGHGQLTILDFSKGVANIGSILVCKKYRGLGYGKKLMQKIMKKGFNDLKMNELHLAVYDFNTVAIKCYKNCGFSEYSRVTEENESASIRWTKIRMCTSKPTI